ncbi:MAG: asparagine synthase (glutamine-hydrolyzing) [Ignavibacteriales bacterium]|nr:asparagine synthase (glutamine-hydrolyzing) [Ignavibacteriales bacterium]
MCGIVGALTFQDSSFKISEDYLVTMRDTMVCRGPDGGGIWIAMDGSIGFGHRRLSIIDMSVAASQPMSNQDGTLWITYNGEIYNHADLRKELEATNKYRWKTDHSDTEVILHAYEEWGDKCINKFRGMFAFALWNANNEELWLVRDRIGVKPLYYSVHHNRITFASEIKALLKDPDQKKSVNEEAFYHYLSFLTSPAPMTMFEGIQKLEAGSWLKINRDGNIIKIKYWDVLDHQTDLAGFSEDEIASMILDELSTSVKLRKVSDVPVGVFLSGGIDSSTNAALFSEGEKSEIKTFTIGYDGNYETARNETEYAKTMAYRVGAQYYEHLLTVKDLIDFIPTMVYLQDEPIADPICVPIYYVSKLARTNGVIVCQLGEGADELFIGYSGWKKILFLQKCVSRFSKIIKKLLMLGIQLFGKQDTLYYEFLRRDCENIPMFWSGAEAFSETHKKRIISMRLQKKFEHRTSWEAIQPIWNVFKEKSKDKSNCQWMSYIDLNLRLPELLLMRVDKMAMGVSLEGRVPFLDHKFVELAMSIPDSLKMKNGILKYMLKKAVKGLIPEELISRKKQGFSVPIYEWMSQQLGEKAKKELTEFCDQTDFLDKAEVMQLLEHGKETEIWCLLNFALWWKQYIHNS